MASRIVDRTIVVEGDALVKARLAQADQVVAASEAARDKAQEWAEGTGAPGGGSTKSAKAWSSQAAAQVPLAAAQVGLAMTARVGAETARSTTEQIRDSFANTAATAQASVQTIANVYSTVAAGLAATAEGKPFDVSTPGEVFATRYLKVNGAAQLVNVLLGRAGVDRIARFIPNLGNVDHSAAINAALADPLVGGVIIAGGDIRLDHAITLTTAMNGKFVRGAGRGATRLVRTGNNISNDPNVYFDQACVVIRGALGVRISDFTAVAPKLANKVQGVWFTENAKYGLCERVEGLNCGYTFWAHSGASFITFRDLRSRNGNVHFEATNATDVLFEQLISDDGDGDNPLGCEAVYHTLYDSKRITFRHGQHVGIGHPILVVNDGVGVSTDLAFDDLNVMNTDGKVMIYSSLRSASTIGRVLLRNLQLNGTPLSPGVVTQLFGGGQWTMKNSEVISYSPDNFQVGEGATLRAIDVDISVTTGADGAAYSGVNNFEVQGGTIRLNGTELKVQPAFSRGYISPSTRVISPNKLLTPSWAGNKVSYVYPADTVTPEGESFANFGRDSDENARSRPALLNGVRYRVKARGWLKKTGSDGNLLVGGVIANYTGFIALQRSDGAMQRTYMADSVVVPAVVDDVRQFEIDVTIVGTDAQVDFGFGQNGSTALAGVEFSIERLT